MGEPYRMDASGITRLPSDQEQERVAIRYGCGHGSGEKRLEVVDLSRVTPRIKLRRQRVPEYAPVCTTRMADGLAEVILIGREGTGFLLPGGSMNLQPEQD